MLCLFISLFKDFREFMEYLVLFGEDSLFLFRNYRLGGLIWDLLEGSKIEDYLFFWIGFDSLVFVNVVFIFNGCDVGIYKWFYFFDLFFVVCFDCIFGLFCLLILVRYDVEEDFLVTEFI